MEVDKEALGFTSLVGECFFNRKKEMQICLPNTDLKCFSYCLNKKKRRCLSVVTLLPLSSSILFILKESGNWTCKFTKIYMMVLPRQGVLDWVPSFSICLRCWLTPAWQKHEANADSLSLVNSGIVLCINKSKSWVSGELWCGKEMYT